MAALGQNSRRRPTATGRPAIQSCQIHCSPYVMPKRSESFVDSQCAIKKKHYIVSVQTVVLQYLKEQYAKQRLQFCNEFLTFCKNGPSKLTPWSAVLTEKLDGPHLVKKFPAFYGTPRSITVFTSARHVVLPEPAVPTRSGGIRYKLRGPAVQKGALQCCICFCLSR